jgi:cytochrome c-type biogenesis protein
VSVDIGFLGALLGGLLSLLSPCSAMLLPAFFAYAFGDRATLVGRTGVFYAGLLTTLVPLGVLAGSAGAWLGGHRTALLTGAAVVVIAMGLLQISGRQLPGLSRRGSADPAGTAAVYALGAAYGLAGACTGPLLGSVLTLAAVGGSPVYGAALLAVFAAGMALPLLALALAWKRLGARGRGWIRPRSVAVGRWRTSLHSLVAGSLSVALGLWLLAADPESLGSVLDIRSQFALESRVAEIGRSVSNAAALAVVATVLLAVFAVQTLRRRTRVGDRPAKRGGQVADGRSAHAPEEDRAAPTPPETSRAH